MNAFALLAILSLSWAIDASFPGVKTTQPYKRSEALDPDQNYLLYWDFNDTDITFEVHVRTKGYVGFGISENGNMFPGDVVVGWIKDGTTHFKNRHTTAHSAPDVDPQQDWTLLHAEENDFGTVLKFVRKIKTCDQLYGKDIQDGTTRLIYSYHPDDPVSDAALMYHGPTRRGTKSIALLTESVQTKKMPDDAIRYDFLNKNYQVPSAPTTYVCNGYQFPNIGGKHHMIKFEPIITPGNEANVHHILVYRCSGIDPSHDGIHYECYKNKPGNFNACFTIFIAWAIGGKEFYFPENVGMSVGAPDDPSFYIMETHYDNPTRKVGMIDDSGIRITLTPTLQQHEAGIWEFGHIVNWLQVIPPGEQHYISQSFCAKECINTAIPQGQEVKAFAALQHAHLLGKGVKTRHFRNGVEIAPLADEPDYDFNFQELRLLRKETPIKRGDSFIVECNYDSSNRSSVTIGGLATTDEMCLSFVLYYPKTAMSSCLSVSTYDAWSTDYMKLHNALVTSNWSDPKTKTTFENILHNSTVSHHCFGDHLNNPNFKYKENPTASAYSPPRPSCT